MAILDNSGDIILDAVLTETGRKRLSTGNFAIAKFALGDDEIDYGLYQKNHASGSAYFDLQILQTPVLEAFTSRNASINYGLMTIDNTNLLYMPGFKRNLKIPSVSVFDRHQVTYLAYRDGSTYNALVTAFGGETGGGPNFVLEAGRATGRMILLETGIDNKDIAGTPANRQNYLVAQGLVNTEFTVSCDNRLFTAVFGPAGGSVFNNDGGNGTEIVSMPLNAGTFSGIDQNLRNHSTTTVAAVKNGVYFRSGDARVDTATSAIEGPRASVTGLTFDVKDLTSEDFVRFGLTGQSIPGDGVNTYSYIDSVVYVRTNINEIQLPIRIIKKD